MSITAKHLARIQNNNQGKIFFLSIILISLAVFNMLFSRIFGVSIYLDGEDFPAVKVVELLVDYDRGKARLVSYSGEGVLGAWGDRGQFILLPPTSDSQHILALKFKVFDPFSFGTERILPKGRAYLEGGRVVQLPADGVKFKIAYSYGY